MAGHARTDSKVFDNFNNYVYLGSLRLGAAFGYVTGPLAAKQPDPQGWLGN